MQALGLIETRGLLAAVESADAMLKAADVTLLEKTKVGGGLISIAVTGEVAAVKAAVDAGAAAVRQICGALLISQHVIPRPHEELDNVMVSVKVLENKEATIVEPAAIVLKEDAPVAEPAKAEVSQQKETAAAKMDPDKISKETADKMLVKSGLDKTIEALGKLKVVELRNLAREYADLGIAGRSISKADKKMLLKEFKDYYKKK